MKIFSSTEDWFVYTNSLFILLVQTSRSSHLFYRMHCNQRHKIVPWSKHRQTKHRRYFFTENSVNVFFCRNNFYRYYLFKYLFRRKNLSHSHGLLPSWRDKKPRSLRTRWNKSLFICQELFLYYQPRTQAKYVVHVDRPVYQIGVLCINLL